MSFKTTGRAKAATQSKYAKPKYYHSLAGRVRHSNLYGLAGRPKKFLLAEICSFTRVSDGKGHAANAALGNVAGVKAKQAGRIKADLIKDGFLTLEGGIGRGYIPAHTLHVEAIEAALDECPGVNFVPLTRSPYPEYKPPSQKGGLNPDAAKKPPLSEGEAPPVSAEAPPPERGIIGDTYLITGGRGPRTVDNAPSGAALDGPAREALERKATGLLIRMDSRYGREMRKASLVGEAFSIEGSEIVATVEGPTNEAFIREAVKSLTAGTDTTVKIVLLNERAP